MGGLFSPDPPSPPPAPAPPPAPSADPDAAAETQRLEAIARNRRGLYGTIATSERGVLAPTATAAAGKSLLGE